MLNGLFKRSQRLFHQDVEGMLEQMLKPFKRGVDDNELQVSVVSKGRSLEPAIKDERNRSRVVSIV